MPECFGLGEISWRNAEEREIKYQKWGTGYGAVDINGVTNSKSPFFFVLGTMETLRHG